MASSPYILIAPTLATAGYDPAFPVPVPGNSSVTSWAWLTNKTGLVAGSTELGDELRLLYRQDQVANSDFASMLSWTWNGKTFAPQPVSCRRMREFFGSGDVRKEIEVARALENLNPTSNKKGQSASRNPSLFLDNVPRTRRSELYEPSDRYRKNSIRALLPIITPPCCFEYPIPLLYSHLKFHPVFAVRSRTGSWQSAAQTGPLDRQPRRQKSRSWRRQLH
jgi:hypothetical protein